MPIKLSVAVCHDVLPSGKYLTNSQSVSPVRETASACHAASCAVVCAEATAIKADRITSIADHLHAARRILRKHGAPKYRVA